MSLLEAIHFGGQRLITLGFVDASTTATIFDVSPGEQMAAGLP